MSDIGVPSRIVMAGTSTLRLHERFSKLPAPKVNKATRVSPANRRNVRATYGDDPFEDDSLMDEDMEEVEYVEPAQRRRKANIILMKALTKRLEQQRHRVLQRARVPIEHRLSVPLKPKIVYVNSNPAQFNNRRGFNRGGFANRGNYHNNNMNNNRGNMGFTRPNRGGFKRGGFNRGGGFQNRGGFMKRGGFQNNQPPKQKTLQELDRELDDYMNRSKHPRITV